jgi:hypothetical protein
MPLVGRDVARQTPRDGPDAAGVQRLQQHGVGQQARDATVAVEERVDPQGSSGVSLPNSIPECGPRFLGPSPGDKPINLSARQRHNTL